MEKYILNYLREHAEDELTAHYIELMKNDLDKMLYGNNPSFSGRNCFSAFSKYNMWKGNVKQLIRTFLIPTKKNPQVNGAKNVLTTNEYGTEEDFTKYGVQLLSINPRSSLRNINDGCFRTFSKTYASMMRKGTFQGALNKDKLELLETLKDDIAEALVKKQINALFTHNDESFQNKYLIEVCKKAGIPSFEFLHGFPAYSQDINTRTDYLCVWGDKIKENFVQNGFSIDRIFVTGAPRFSKFIKKPEFLRNSFEDVLVATSSATMYLQHGWIMDEYGDQNNSLLILYIYQVEQALKQIGIKQARLRPHQSVDKQWLSKYIDTDFYTFDYENVNDSLKRSTMVIGPHSTLMMDALCNGVNYYAFDPGENGHTIRGAKIIPPFDGKDGYVKVAETEKELTDNIQNKVLLDPRFLDGYLQPFDLTPIMGLF